MSQSQSCLSDISLVVNNFGDAIVFAGILDDWFEFLGGRPGEIVVVDSGSDAETQNVYWQLFQQQKIDKLQIIRPVHEDSHGDAKTGYIQDYTAASIASKPYILWFHTDTLPYRSGHDQWLEEAIGYLERPDTMAIGSSRNSSSQHHDAWPGWYFTDQCSLSFALMKRRTFVDAIHAGAGDFLIWGSQAHHPITVEQSGHSVATLLETYIQTHNAYILCKVEGEDWTVCYANLGEERLQKAREEYLAR